MGGSCGESVLCPAQQMCPSPASLASLRCPCLTTKLPREKRPGATALPWVPGSSLEIHPREGELRLSAQRLRTSGAAPLRAPRGAQHPQPGTQHPPY